MQTYLPKCEETNNAHSHKQLNHENGVDLQVDKRCVRAMWHFLLLIYVFMGFCLGFILLPVPS